MEVPHLLEPDWLQARPTFAEVQEMCRIIELEQVELPAAPYSEFLRALRESHSNGGAYLVAFRVLPNSVFDWYASRNRLVEEDLLDSLLTHKAIRTAVPDLGIPETKAATGLVMADPFLLDGRLAHRMFHGGAYSETGGDGRLAKLSALGVCRAMFDLRFGEITVAESFDPWTPWFCNIAWDMTMVIFDRRRRLLWLFAITDTD
jgi:hypothetical protein